jgi:hypothetical protein
MHFRILLPLIIALLSTNTEAVIIDRIAAIVNDHVISQSEVEAYKKLGLEISGLPEQEVPLQERINHHLVLAQIKRQPPISISEERIRETVESFTKEHGGNEEFLVFLNSVGMNFEEFYNEVREQLMIHEFINIRFRPFVNVQIEEAEKYYNETYKPALEQKGKPVPSFEESFDKIQAELARSRVKQRTLDWLAEIRRESSVYIKE